ncbi:MAG TPA: RtcB family protein [Thermoplasmata archaeon]|jgi:tRNA-splicing ligase RtcB|nr:RtcB family protein [Thermoplasmata archaeon]
MTKVPRLIARDAFTYEIPVDEQPGMRVPGILYSNEALLSSVDGDPSLQQLANVATLPGIVRGAYAMPDIHFGYGFPVGGVAAFDPSDGVVSPGGIGYDINCGVRLLRTNLTVEEVRPRLRELVDTLYREVPTGVGSKGGLSLSPGEVFEVLAGGADWAVSHGHGRAEDLLVQEENGRHKGAAPDHVSDTARKRGLRQLGTLGSGNHFLEVQAVDEVYHPEFADTMGLRPGSVTVMLHTGSRGLGHQVATDYIARFDARLQSEGTVLVDRQLSCAPIASEDGQRYLGAMAAGANFAWANRQLITAGVRRAFRTVFGRPDESMDLAVVYDIAHNIAKVEQHRVNGGERPLLVHRKGATRAFAAGREEVPTAYRSFGQPVLIPGDMGTASYVLVGLPTAMERSFGSSCHGAGRRLSRHAAVREFRFDDVTRALSSKGILVRSASREGVTEEAPGAYKNVDEVVKVAEGAGLTRRVARLIPLGVVKG